MLSGTIIQKFYAIYACLHPKYIPADATRTVKIIAKLTQINHLLSVHPALDFRIRSDESVPDEADDDGENKACSGLPQIY